jgi:hypothetical protein
MFDDVVYDADYQKKFNLLTELVATRLGAATDPSNLRQKLSRIQLKGNPSNTISLSNDGVMPLDNAVVVSVRAEATVNQVYIDLDNIEMILADGTLQEEFFTKLEGISSSVYTVQEKQIDNLGLLFRFVR